MTRRTPGDLLDEQTLARALRDDVRAGLTADPKWLPPKWFYDARGSELFEEITRLPEYYPTRAERAVLAEHAAEIARITGAKTLVELGSGSSDKTRLLLDALTPQRGAGGVRAAGRLGQRACAVHRRHRGRLPGPAGARHRRRLHPAPGQRCRPAADGWWRSSAALSATCCPTSGPGSCAALRAALDPGEWLLLGTDLVKDPAVLVPAYDDAAGVTAEFNRNVLRVINRELGADFDPGGVRPCRRAGTPTRVDRDAAAGPAGDAGDGWRRST